MINGKDVTELMDPNLKGKFSTEEATIVLKLASECLQWKGYIENGITKKLVATLKALQAKKEVRRVTVTIISSLKIFRIHVIKPNLFACRFHLLKCMK